MGTFYYQWPSISSVIESLCQSIDSVIILFHNSKLLSKMVVLFRYSTNSAPGCLSSHKPREQFSFLMYKTEIPHTCSQEQTQELKGFLLIISTRSHSDKLIWILASMAISDYKPTHTELIFYTLKKKLTQIVKEFSFHNHSSFMEESAMYYGIFVLPLFL